MAKKLVAPPMFFSRLRCLNLLKARSGTTVRSFNAAEELLYDPRLGTVFKTAIEKGCAVVTPKAKTR
jgi:hypothetical protein